MVDAKDMAAPAAGLGGFLERHPGFRWDDTRARVRFPLGRHILVQEDGDVRFERNPANDELYDQVRSGGEDAMPSYEVERSADGGFLAAFRAEEFQFEPWVYGVSFGVHETADGAAAQIEAMVRHMDAGNGRGDVIGLLGRSGHVQAGSDYGNNLVLYPLLKSFDDSVVRESRYYFDYVSTTAFSIHLWLSHLGLYPVGASRFTCEPEWGEEDDAALRDAQAAHMRDHDCQVTDVEVVDYLLDDVDEDLFFLDRGQLEDLVLNHAGSYRSLRERLVSLAASGAVTAVSGGAADVSAQAMAEAEAWA